MIRDKDFVMVTIELKAWKGKLSRLMVPICSDKNLIEEIIRILAKVKSEGKHKRRKVISISYPLNYQL
jgi:hypothetical protein